LFDTAKAGLTEDEIFVCGILTEILGRMPTEKRGYDALQTYIDLNTGGITMSSLSLSKNEPSVDSYLALLKIRLRLLPSKLKEVPNIIKELLTQTKFSDYSRLYELLKEMKAHLDMDFQTDPHAVLSSIIESVHSPSADFMDRVEGLRFSRYLNKILSAWKPTSSSSDGDDDDVAKNIAEKLGSVSKKLFNSKFVTILLTSEKQGLNTALESDFIRDCLASIISSLSSSEKSSTSFYDEQMKEFSKKENDDVSHYKPEKHAYVTSTTVNYVGLGQNMIHLGAPKMCGFREVLEHIIRYDYLWPLVRVQGGAYGCMVRMKRSGALSFISYRDPRLHETIDVYRELPDFIAKLTKSSEDMELAIIGTIGEVDIPYAAAQAGTEAAIRYLTGYNDDWRQQFWEQMLSCTMEDIHNEGQSLKIAIDHADIISVVSSNVATANKDIFDIIEPLIQ